MKAQIREIREQDVILLMPENANEALELVRRMERGMVTVPLDENKAIVPADRFFEFGRGSWCIAVPLVTHDGEDGKIGE